MLTEDEKRDEAPADYVQRVNWAIDYIISNLEKPLRLEDVAKVACFSPYHFHRVFGALMGETLNDFLTRLRLERALTTLTHNPKKNLTDVAMECGFASSSNFSRVFKAKFGVPPSKFDIESLREKRREELIQSIPDPEEGNKLKTLPPGANPDGFKVKIVSLPPRVVAYIRVLDPYQPGHVTSAYERLMAWADESGVMDNQWLGYMWDDPTIVSTRDCRYDAGVVVDDVVPKGEIGRIEFPEMQVAQIEVRGPLDLEQRALDYIYGTWLPQSGYVPSSQPGFEAWIGRPFAHGYEHFELYAQIPIVRG